MAMLKFQKEKENWGYIMEQYLVERDQLKNSFTS